MDALTQLTTNPTLQKLAKRLSLPLKLPTLVRRQGETDPQKPLLARRVALTVTAESAPLVRALADLGASFVLSGDDSHTAGAADIARSAGRDVAIAALPEKIDALILEVGAASALFDQVQPALKKLSSHCRVLLIARHPKKPTSKDAANIDAVTGFAKSLAREVGQRAITVNVIEVAQGAAPEAVASAVAYFAGDRARYVTAQRVKLGPTKAAAGGLSLDGEHAIVTGGARGIGAAIAQILARQGARVTLCDLPNARDAAADVINRIERAGGKASFVAADVTKDEEVKALIEKAAGATILVNNAGITRDKTFAKMTKDKWDQVIAVNFEASVRCAEQFLAARDPKKPASLVFLSSVVGISGNFGQTNYTLSKAAVIGYVRALAEELEGKGVRVNAIAPGMIDTVLTREVPLLNREVGKQMICLLQAGEPEDIGELVAFLAAPASAAINGQTLRVDGGMFMGA